MTRLQSLSLFIKKQERAPLTLGLFFVSFIALIGFRLVVEFSLSSFEPQTLTEIFFTFSHTFLFFLFAFALFLPLLQRGAHLKFKSAANVLLLGFLIIVFPPLIDKLVFGSEFYWSFYTFDSVSGLLLRYLTFFGDSPQVGITYGVRVEVALVVIGLVAYIQSRTRSWKRSLGGGLAAYTLLFVLGSFPSWITFVLFFSHTALLDIQSIHIAELFLSPESILGRELVPLRAALSQKMSLVYACAISFTAFVLLAKSTPRYFKALLSNLRVPQVFYHGGLLFLGILFANIFQRPLLRFDFFDALALAVLLIAVGLAWIAAVIANDIIDINIDKISNPKRPLPTETIPSNLYATFGYTAFGFSLFFASLVSFQSFLLLFGYQVISLLYSLPPLRLKRLPFVATGIAAFAGMIIFSIGYTLIAPTHSLSGIPLSLFLFLLAAYTIVLPLKDFKDIVGDRHDGVFTIPVILGQEKARHAMSVALFSVFIASVFFIHAPEVFPWTLLWATLAFWVIEKTERSRWKALSFRNLPAWVLILAACYGLGLFIFLA